MALSKPSYFTQDLVAFYFEQLDVRPLRTKALTSCVLSLCGNLIAQRIGDAEKIDRNSVIASALFGLLFAGTIPHFSYQFLDKIIPRHNSRTAVLKQLLVERLLFTPLFQYFALYTVNRLQGKSHPEACKQQNELYWTLLKANLRIITIIQFINLKYVPPKLRVLVGNLTGFFWIIYTVHKRQAAAKKKKMAKIIDITK